MLFDRGLEEAFAVEGPKGFEELDNMFVSTRETFRKERSGWAAYAKFQGSGDHSEVRTVDALLNPYPPNSGDIEVSPETLDESVDALPAPKAIGEYYLLAINLDRDAPYVPTGWKLLGYDLSDETRTSSLLNCGPWKGLLAPFTKRQNSVGLLSRPDAESAQKLLPTEWGEGEPHSHVVVWALYERE